MLQKLLTENENISQTRQPWKVNNPEITYYNGTTVPSGFIQQTIEHVMRSEKRNMTIEVLSKK